MPQARAHGVVRGTTHGIPFLDPATRALNTPGDLRSEVVRRMEVYILHLLHGWTIESERSSSSSVVDSSTHGQTLTPAEGGPPCPRAEHNHARGYPPPPAPLLSLPRLRNDLLVLAVLYSNVQQALTSTQRDVFYHLVRQVSSQRAVNEAIQRLVARMGVPRQALGVVAGARGTVGGSLRYRGLHLAGSAGMAIPLYEEDLRVRSMRRLATRTHADHAQATDSTPHAPTAMIKVTAEEAPFTFDPNVRAILVVEKHAVFHRLMQERLPARLPCVLMTAHGFPTHGARQLLHNLHRAAPALPVLALVDYNPSGVAMLLQYRWGGGVASSGPGHALEVSRGRGARGGGTREASFCAVPALAWLGPRSVHLGFTVPPGVTATAAAACGQRADVTVPMGLPCQPFTPRDAALMQTMQQQLCASEAAAAARVEISDAVICTGLQRSPALLPPPPLKRRDGRQVVSPVCGCAAWAAEAAVMAAAGVKVEIEAMVTRGSMWQRGSCGPCARPEMHERSAPAEEETFADWVCQLILGRDYI